MSPASFPSPSPLNSFHTPILANWPMFAALLVLLILVKVLSNARFKGSMGERMVAKGLASLDPASYHVFHDLYLPRPDGQGSTQVDHVVISPFGIFVIETKNYRGWIFGSEKQREWTQQIHRKKNRFQNPLHQNDLHIHALMDFLGLSQSVFHSVVFFIGDATFKTPMPDNVLNRGLRQWIENHSDKLLQADLVAHIRQALAAHESKTDRKSAASQHLRDLKERL